MQWRLPNMKHDNCLVLDLESTGQPWNGRIVCIGCKNVHTGETKTFYDQHEETLIINFLKFFNKHNITELIGYNVHYDFRQIISKCLKFRIKLKEFQYVKLIDIMKLLKEVNHGHNFNQPGKLNEWSRYLLGQEKLSKNGTIKDLLAQGRLIEILDYNRQDVELTYQLWKRIKQVMEV